MCLLISNHALSSRTLYVPYRTETGDGTSQTFSVLLYWRLQHFSLLALGEMLYAARAMKRCVTLLLKHNLQKSVLDLLKQFSNFSFIYCRVQTFYCMNWALSKVRFALLLKSLSTSRSYWSWNYLGTILDFVLAEFWLIVVLCSRY